MSAPRIGTLLRTIDSVPVLLRVAMAYLQERGHYGKAAS